MKNLLKAAVRGLARHVPPLRQLLVGLHAAKHPLFFPAGHFYSPLISAEEIHRDEQRIFASPPASLPAIDLRVDEQRQLLEEFAEYYKDLPFKPEKQPGLRYRYENPNYLYSDAIFLACMIRHARPARFLEVGCGYSSCVTLDINECDFSNAIECTFIDPYPDLLGSFLTAEDRERVRILPQRIQDVALEEFEKLAPNDILFIDSTHVSKTGSDVNRIIFEILPALRSGVYIHFHDIFYPFEYPTKWVYEGRGWNEAYTLRAFLEYNTAFEIVCFNTFLAHRFPEFFEARMPLCLKNTGASIWLRKR
ncbi:MAG: class I SAM-dependent methyltransferase [Chthoniobacterales bacterium]